MIADNQTSVIPQPRLENMASIGVAALVAFSAFYTAPAILAGVELESDPSQASDGSLGSQLFFTGLFLLIVGILVAERRSSVLLRTPRFLVPTLTWCWFSLLWAVDPSVSIRRLIYLSVVFLSISYLVEILSYDRLMKVLVAIFAFIVVADWLAVAFLPLATVNPTSGMNWEGGWRGLHIEKNGAGAIYANILILFLHETIRMRSRIVGPFLCVASGLMLVLTHSKTAIGFAIISILIGAICSGVYSKVGLRLVVLMCLVVVIITIVGNFDDIFAYSQALLEEPQAFSGRTQVWSALIEFAHDHFLFGAGYGSFWAIGARSPILSYGEGWLEIVHQAHNGYLELLVGIGFLGLLIGVFDLVIRPLAVLFTKPLVSGISRSLLCSLVTFTCLHNLFESTFLNRASPTWIIALLAYSALFKGVVKARVFSLKLSPSLDQKEAPLRS